MGGLYDAATLQALVMRCECPCFLCFCRLLHFHSHKNTFLISGRRTRKLKPSHMLVGRRTRKLKPSHMLVTHKFGFGSFDGAGRCPSSQRPVPRKFFCSLTVKVSSKGPDAPHVFGLPDRVSSVAPFVLSRSDGGRLAVGSDSF